MKSSNPNVPHQGRFVGREDDVAGVEAILCEGPGNVAVYGAPGVGKSRLAAHIALRWREGGDAVAYVDGRDIVDEATFLDALAQALGLPPVVELDRQGVIRQLRDALVERAGLLVVLDDVEKLRGEITELLTPMIDVAQVSVLLTSRTTLAIPGVEPFQLAPLSEARAMELFVTRARRIQPGFDPSQTASGVLEALVERLDCLPLAIELAAPRLTILTLMQLLERLDRRFQILRPGYGTENLSRIALSEAIGVSWELLDEGQRATLVQCAVFSGGFDLEAAEAVVSVADEELWVGDLLQSLIMQSLVMTTASEGVRFSLLESIRDYALEFGDVSQIQGARERHARYFEESARQWFDAVPGGDGGPAVRRLCEESSNVLAVVEQLSADEPKRALSLLCRLAPGFSVRGLLGGYLDRFDACRQALANDEPPRAMLTRSTLLGEGGRLGEALQVIDETLQVIEHEDTPQDPSIGEVLMHRGRILRGLGRLDEARADWERALEISTEPFWLFQINNELGLLELNRARFGADGENDGDALERGAGLLKHAYELARRHTHALYRVRPTVGWALALHETGETGRALRLLRKERDTQARAGYRNAELLCEHHIAILEFYSGRYARALQIAAEVDRGLARAGLAARRARNTSYRAIFANAAGRLDETAGFVANALDASEQTGQEITALVADVQGVMVAWERQDHAAARTHLERALVSAESVGSPGHGAFLNAYRAFLMVAEGDRQHARSVCEQAIESLQTAAEYRHPAENPRWEVVARAWRAILVLSCAPDHIEEGNWDLLYDALAMADVAAEAPDDGLTAVACRQAEHLASRVRREQGLPKRRPAHILRILDDGMAFRLDGQDKVDLSSRDPLRRILVALAARARSGESSAELEAVVDIGWPGEDLESQSAANRVYATIRLLRNLGLKDILITDEGGYRLADDVLVL